MKMECPPAVVDSLEDSHIHVSDNDAKVEANNVNNNNSMLSDDRDTDSPPVIVTLRMKISTQEVGGIIGRKGENVKKYRELSGAKINISDASTNDRIVTFTGMCDQIRVAFYHMCVKFEDDLRASKDPESTKKEVSVRLVIPASQCGSLIGKEGVRIKQLRESTGAEVQVAGVMLPDSTEREVIIKGGATAISNCTKRICSIMLESPPKGSTIPYRPKKEALQIQPQTYQTPMMYGMTAYGLPGQPAPGIPAQGHALAQGQAIAAGPGLAGQAPMGLQPHLAAVSMASSVSSSEAPKVVAQQSSPAFSQAGMAFQQQSMAALQQPYASLSQQGAPLILPPAVSSAAAVNPYAALMQQGALGVPMLNAMNSYLAAGAGRAVNMYGVPSQAQHNQSTEMVIPNELIGCIIGRGGAKINEIRQLSGAQIKISNCEEGTNDRKVTITGYPDTISMATYLINTSVEIHKAQLLLANQEQANATNPTAAAVSVAATASAMPASTLTTPTSISSQSNSSHTGQLNAVAAVAGSNLMANNATACQLQSMQKQVNQNGTGPVANVVAAASAAMPGGYAYAAYQPATSVPHAAAAAAASLPYGYSFAPQYGLAASYDPRSVLAASNKLKMLPGSTGVKLTQRYAPY